MIVDSDPESNYVTAIVPEDQLTLAIGKRGQNARLAAHLTGMHIDIKTEALAAEIQQSVPMVADAASDDLAGEETVEHRCEYVSPTGVACRNMARPGSAYCGIHEKMAELDDAEVSDDPDSLV